MLFVPIPETPEQDFIAQVKLPNAGDARAYAYLWPVGDGYRLTIAAPRALDQLAAAEPLLVAHIARRARKGVPIGCARGRAGDLSPSRLSALRHWR